MSRVPGRELPNSAPDSLTPRNSSARLLVDGEVLGDTDADVVVAIVLVAKTLDAGEMASSAELELAVAEDI